MTSKLIPESFINLSLSYLLDLDSCIFAIFGPISWVPKYKKYENFQKKIKNTSWNWKSNRKIVLESSEAKENNNILKKKSPPNFGGFPAPLNPPFLGFLGVLGEPETPKILKKIFFQKFIIFFGL